MNACRRLAAALALLLGTIGLVLTLAGGIGVWIVKEPIRTKTMNVFVRIETALNVAENGLEETQASLARASERLGNVKEEHGQAGRAPGGAIGRMLARTVQQRLAPELGDAQETLHKVAEAAVVVNSMLDDVGNFPLFATSGLDLDRVNEMNRQLAGVAPAAWELSRLLAEPGADSDSQVSRVERTLQTLSGLIADYQTQVTPVRQRVDDLKAGILFWLTPAAALMSFVFFWIALSQVSVLCHAWSWLRPRLPAA